MVLFLDNQHRLIKRAVILGTINVSAVNPREIIKEAPPL